MQAIVAFCLNDFRNVCRDSLLFFIFVMPWLICLLLRYLVPYLNAWSHSRFGLVLEPYYPLILSFFVLLEIPMFVGLVFGLLLLDEKDDKTLTALQITPVSLETYAFYRFLVAVGLSSLFVSATLPLTRLMPLPPLIHFVPTVLISGMTAVLVMLLLVAFANNKVEGLAIMKAFGIFMLGPGAAFFIEGPWQLLGGLLPTYWSAKTFWVISAGNSPWAYLIVGLLYNLLLIYLLQRRFQKRGYS